MSNTTAPKRKGKQTAETPGVYIIGAATVAGEKESQGPFGNLYDLCDNDPYFGESSWEKAETKLQKRAAQMAATKAGLSMKDVELLIAGDLLNQCISSSFAVRELAVPFYGIFGACSTMAQSMSIGAMAISGGFVANAICGTSSHFCSAERQFRTPVEYGGQRVPTAQWTVTGSGMAALSNTCPPNGAPRVSHITIGKINDKGITDPNNMGAAMAPAAADTITAFFADSGISPADIDLVVTGDLGKVGMEITGEMLSEQGINLNGKYKDCGVMVFSDDQNVNSGGSGCGCSAIVFCAHILKELNEKRLNRVLLVGTGALMSPTSTGQGESIPAIAHAVLVENS